MYKFDHLCDKIAMVRKQIYPSDLTDREWKVLERLIPEAKKRGRPPRYPKREIVNAIFYLVRSGCSWRMLPHDLPPWRICYYYFMIWKRDGVWVKIHDQLRDMARVHAGKKKPQPLRSSTRRALNLLITPEFAAMMQESGSSEEKDTFLWTHWD